MNLLEKNTIRYWKASSRWNEKNSVKLSSKDAVEKITIILQNVNPGTKLHTYAVEMYDNFIRYGDKPKGKRYARKERN